MYLHLRKKMKSDRKKEVIVGIVSLASLVILILALLFGENVISQKNKYTATIEFQDVGGLQSGDPVYLSGVSIGKVKSVKLTGRKVLVEVFLQDISEFRSDVSAKISMVSIMGGKKIDIVPGINSGKYNPDNIIIGAESTDFTSVLSDISSMKGDIITSVKRIDSIAVSVNDLLGDPAFISNLKGTVSSANSVVGKINQFTDVNQGKQILQNLNEASKSLNDIASGNKADINDIVKKLKTTSNYLSEFAENNPDLGKDVNLIVKDLKVLTNQLTKNESIIGKLLNDKEFSNQLAGTLKELEELIQNISEYGINTNVRLGSRP